MKLEIVTKTDPIEMLGRYGGSVSLDDAYTREVYIDGKLVPKGLADIILLGLDHATEQYCDMIEQAMKNDGLEIRRERR